MEFKENVTECRVSVIIPNWNGRHLLEACLKSLRGQTFVDFEVVLVDNGSSDGSVEYVRKYFPDVKLVPLAGNSGFSPAVNLGIKICVGEYIVLLNNDTKVDKNCLSELVKTADLHKDVGMIAAKMLNFYKPHLIDSAGDYIDIVGHANNIGLGEKDGEQFNKEGYVFLVTGGGSLFKREVFEKIGFLDPLYFAYMEDVDFCLRAQFAGFKGYYQPKAIIYHIHKATSKKNPAFLEYLQFRNMTQTIIKDFPVALLLKDFNWVNVLLVHLNTIRFLAMEGFLWPAIKADLFILRHLGHLLRERKRIQGSRVVSDEYIIANFQEKKLKFPIIGRI